MTLIPIRRAPGNQLDDNMIPLINIVFLMLIFFMIAGQLSSSELLKIQPPTSHQQSALQEHDAILFVSAKGPLAMDDVFLEVSALTEILKQKIAETNDIQSFKLLVKADAAVPAIELTDLLKQVRAAGVLKVSLATQTQTSRND
ncbi:MULTISPECIES: biopolymer transporter ExbD [unclassified Methylophaga]|jgi:biopolymer transport protein ExbD|uniref:ExbD/TolR family protein n=1 Tax=unclassified Methylophaga TaxID=2629249 RepID=UPI000EC54A41|nr:MULTISPECIES: biopolymer transporter ExbD [unclassified Methylophaga]HAD29974.1 biopolymer transporter ExbD [Methylophaga sp.]|tara:strand:- start:62588 stop:63019 length:432 start_codon:yes stop_codon:yes gene_type:complete